MKLPRPFCCGVTALIAAAGCGSKSLQNLDAFGGGTGSIDAGGIGTGDGGVADGTGGGGGGATDSAIDRPWNVTFGGRRGFNVTAAVQVETNAGAMDGIVHTFTMMLDTDQRVAIIGADSNTQIYPVEQTAAGPLHVVGSPRFGVYVPASCGGNLTYLDVSFTIDSSGQLSGSGRGTLMTLDSQFGETVAATMVLAGVLDTQPPTLELSPAGDLADPWTAFWLVSSEPLPGQEMRPVLRSASGDIMALEAPTGMETFITVLAKPARMLRYNDEYRVTFDGITDLAGNAPASTVSASFTTRAPPPLVSADGFESVTDPTLGGAQVLSAADAPTIAGARSLYVPPVPAVGTPPPQLALRVSILPGNTVLRFDYRTVNPGAMGIAYFVVASVGGTIGTATLPSEPAATSTPITIGQVQVSLGPTMSATIGLPADAHGEVVLGRIALQSAASCAGPAPQPVSGLIIDNLRAE
jgi:hypothetical protein